MLDQAQQLSTTRGWADRTPCMSSLKVLASLTHSRSWRTMHSFSLLLITEGCCVSPICNLEGRKGQQGNATRPRLHRTARNWTQVLHLASKPTENPSNCPSVSFRKGKLVLQGCIKIFISSLLPLSTWHKCFPLLLLTGNNINYANQYIIYLL